MGALETAAQVGVEQSSAVWVWIMQELRLGPQYFLAIREAVQQGRWRTAKNPKSYIKTAAKREALKMGLVNEGSGNLVLVGSSRSEGEETSGEEALEYLGHQYDSRDAAKQVGMKGSPEGRDTRERHTGSHLFRCLKYPRVCDSALPKAPKARHSLAPTVRSGKAKSMMVSPEGRNTIERKG